MKLSFHFFFRPLLLYISHKYLMHYVRTSEISEIHFIFSSTGKTSTIDWHWVLGGGEGRDRNPKKLSIIFSNRVSMIWFYRFLKIFVPVDKPQRYMHFFQM
jgi:hypothetical protein